MYLLVPKVMTAHHFWVQNGSIALNKNFFRKTINISLMASVIMENLLKSSLESIQGYDHISFLGTKWPISPGRVFWKNH